jgi:hypothetical protein
MSTTDSRCVVAALPRILVGGLLLFTGLSPLFAGGGGPSLEARLEDASYVIRGQITQIEEKGAPNLDQHVHWGIATVPVKEALKGNPPKTVQFDVVTKVAPGYAGSAVLFPRRVGDSGVWIIDSQGLVSPNSLVLSEERAAEIRKILNPFGEKGWSEPVNGLRIWAGAVPSHVVLIVHNVSRADIFLPFSPLMQQTNVPPQPGFLSAGAKSRDGRDFALFLDDGLPRSQPVPCVKVSPGKAIYLPGAFGEFGFFLDRKYQLPPGHYSVVVTYKNQQVEGDAKDQAGRTERVRAWTGELKAPAVQFMSSEVRPTAVTPR